MRWPKQELLTVKLPKARKTKWSVTAKVYKGLLLLDCFYDTVKKGRYVIDPEGRHEFFSEKWKVCGIEYATEGWYGWGPRPDQERDSKIIADFCKCDEKRAIRGIEMMEFQYNNAKLKRAHERKYARIKARMEKIPQLPEKFLLWIEGYFQDYGLKFEGKDLYYCTACNRIESGKIKAGKKTICVGGKTIIGTRRKEVIQKEKFLLLQDCGDQCVARYFDVVARYTKDGVYMSRVESIRMLMGKTGERPLSIFYGQDYRTDEDQQWWDTNPRNFRWGSAYCFSDGVNEALKGTRYDKLGIPFMAAKGWKLQYNNLMANYPVAGAYEYIAKMGLERLLKEETENRLSIYGCYTDLWLQGKTAEDVLKISMQRIHRLKAANGSQCYLKWLKLEEANAVFQYKIPEETIRFMDENKIYPSDLNFIRDRMTDAKSAHFIERQMKQYKKNASYIIDQWKDYLSMAERLGLDVYDEIIFRPKELLKRHDSLVEEINSVEEDEQAEAMKTKFPKAEGILKRIKAIYEYEGNDFIIMVPTTIKQIMADSKELHHCAGASERYYERIEAHETYIMFLRKKTLPQRAWYTLEVEPGGTVRQKRSEYNRQPDLQKVNTYIKEWQKNLKDRMDEEQRILQEESRLKRIAEMDQLKESENTRDNQLYNLLSGDLLEVI